MRFLASCIVLGCVGGLLPCVLVGAPLHPRLTKAATDPLWAAELQRAISAGLDRPLRFTPTLPPNVLVLLVDFADRPAAPNWTPADLDSSFFGPSGSLSAYYRRASFDRYKPEGRTSAWLRAPQSLSFYVAGRRGIGEQPGRNARALVAAVVRGADGEIDFSRFDNDGPDGIPSSGDDDGMVDALIVVHAGEAAETSGSWDDFLSHAWYTEQRVDTADGVFAWTYAFVSIASPLGVRVHEFGHLLGLPDLYSRRAVSRQGPGGLGDWSLMGSGSWLGDGERPADLDAPSKIELGFVDPIVPVQNATQLELRAAADGSPPTVYQVWTHGLLDAEFFVIENRRPQGLDALLPGGGMLVYHVDRRRANNDDPEAPRVRLLQADGREDLEWYRNPGDSGDPYPGGGGSCCRLDADTFPGTRASDGEDTQIVIASISIPTSTMRFDLQIENRPLFHVVDQSVEETDGDGDGLPEAGEELALTLTLENQGLASTDLEFVWRAEPEEAATWSVDRGLLRALGKGERGTMQLTLRPAAALGDPSALPLLGWSSTVAETLQVESTIGLGTRRGFQACLNASPSRFTGDCSDPEAPWSSVVLQGDAGWMLESPEAELSQVYRSARGERYPNDADVVLVSPPFNLEAGSELHLLHAYAMEDLEAGWSRDGGRVELSLHGGAWEAIEPFGGYPRRIEPESIPRLAGAGVFAGRSGRRWDRFPLAERQGSARIRFRLASNDSIGERGWEIARVEVRTPLPGTPTAGLHLLAEPNPARLPTSIRFRIDAPRSMEAQPTRLRLFDLRGRLVRVLSIAPVPSQSGQFLWDGTDRAGHLVATGLYLARLEWGGAEATAKILILR